MVLWALFLLLSLVSISASCPEQLVCSFPKSSVKLPHPTEEGCTKTVCVCKGTENRITSSWNTRRQYKELESRYTNCTLVDGNLELVGVQDFSKVIDFTKHIEQVTGYVLISRVYADYIDLSSLRLIRGVNVYVPMVYNTGSRRNCPGNAGQSETSLPKNPSSEPQEKYALYVTSNANGNTTGLKELWMPKLTEISNGDVLFFNNPMLCHIDTISWKEEIFEDSDKQNVTIVNISGNPPCPPCPSSCSGWLKDNSSLRCWGNSSNLCQKITRAQCDHCSEATQRCDKKIVNGARQCCSAVCSAGCHGRGASKCHACKFMNNNGTCVSKCPFVRRVNPFTEEVVSPDKRYQFSRYCVESCPRNVPQSGEFCRRYCPEGEFDFENNVCTSCEDGKCDHICKGLGTGDGPLKNDDSITINNIKNFSKRCTVIEGSLYFGTSTFEGDSHCNFGPITSSDLFDVFSNVREITGFLAIEKWNFKDLCIFKNLERIRGKELRDQRFSLYVYTGKSNLRELCLNSLKSIDNGAVAIAENSYLCHQNTIKWDQFTNSSNPNHVPESNRECGDVVIWQNKRLCFTETIDWTQFFLHSSLQSAKLKKRNRNRSCKNAPCNRQCNQTKGCWGPSNQQCVKCLSYVDVTNASGHFTPSVVIDPATGLSYPGYNVTTCVSECNLKKGVYASADKMCLPCDPRCNLCTGPGPTNCVSCRNATMPDGSCLYECPVGFYLDTNHTCQPCDSGCFDGGCNGPRSAFDPGKGCKACYFQKDSNTKQQRFTGRHCAVCSEDNIGMACSDGCTFFNKSGPYECYTIPGPNYALIALCIPVLLLIIGLVMWRFYKHKTTIKQMRQAIGDTMVGEMGQEDEVMPLTPSGTAPNQAHLRIVRDTELAIGKLLGKGAFGEVHKAIWTPLNIQGEKVKIAVAVKTLTTPEEMTQVASNEIMDEAYLMASVDCNYLVRLLGIQMTGHVSLISQLMPLGNSLEYVRNEKIQITIHSRQMLTWFVQIAKGMKYLEEKHLVHRDLAARNVLVKTPNHVKITDFGLAKMLKLKEDTYQAEGGKLPIKWLAIECITQRQFSHLSDVWAFGVTCWELLTFGSKPYEGVRAIDVLSLLERGERLPQPPTATIEIYMLLVKCWMVDRQCRPSFAKLVNEFTRMVADPTRYLVIKNDPGFSMLSPNPADEDQFFRKLLEEEKVDDAIIADEPDQYLLTNELNNQPAYANQDVINSVQKMHPKMNGPQRLFSRSTPSANFEPLPSSSTSTGRSGDSDNDTMLQAPADQDDVFADGGNSSKRINDSKAVPRNDAEDIQRYSEDPTKSKVADSKKPSVKINKSQTYDEEQYLIPMPSIKETGKETHETDLSSFINDTYVENLPLNEVRSQPPQHEYENISASAAQNDYVNTSERDDHATTAFANEEYMATDSGIGEDSHSLHRGRTGRHDTWKESAPSSGDEAHASKDSNPRFRPKQHARNVPLQRNNDVCSTSSDGSSPGRSRQTALNNPEYMFLNDSLSRDKSQRTSDKDIA